MRQFIGAIVGYGGPLWLPGSLFYLPLIVLPVYPILFAALRKRQKKLPNHGGIVTLATLGGLGFSVPETVLGGGAVVFVLALAIPVLAMAWAALALMIIGLASKSYAQLSRRDAWSLLWLVVPVLLFVILGSNYGFVTRWSIFG